MYVVMTRGKIKKEYIQFRVRGDFKEDVQRTAETKGLSVSGLIHSLLVGAVREAKQLSPEMFEKSELPANDIHKRDTGAFNPRMGKAADVPVEEIRDGLQSSKAPPTATKSPRTKKPAAKR